MVTNELGKMLVRFYNMQAGTNFRWSEKTQEKISVACKILDDDVVLAKKHIRDWVQQHPDEAKNGMTKCFLAVVPEQKKEEVQIEAKAETGTAQTAQTALGLMEQVVTEILVKTQAQKIGDAILADVENRVRDFIKSEYGTIERKIVTVVDGKPIPVKGIQHEKFETVLKFVANDEPIFLTGPAGSGKNVLCKQVAEALGLKFYFTNAVTQEYKLTGFTDANGKYQETQFYKAFTEGGVFMLDEMDASIPEVLIILNAAIANRYFDFPAPIGYKEAHPDFRVIAAGNTVGTGASYQYIGRNQLDAASLDRFAIVKIDYCKTIEDSVAGGDTELADFCRDFRKAAEEAGTQIIVSYRAIGRLAKMKQILTLEEALKTCLVKGIEREDLSIIKNAIRIRKHKEYADALDKIGGEA